MNKRMKKITERGITLVALVITIILLLILAGVTISIAMKTGIMNKAETAVDKYSEQQAIENVKLALVEYKMEKLSKGNKQLGEILAPVGGSIKQDTTDNWIIIIKEYEVTVNKNSGDITSIVKNTNGNTGMPPSEPVLSDIYFTVYNDGTLLVFASTNEQLDDATVTKECGNIAGMDFATHLEAPWADYREKIKEVRILDEIKPISTAYWFYGMNNYNFKNIDVSNINTSNTINMSNMFNACRYLETLDLSSFDTHNVENMEKMFYGCRNLESLDISNFNTSNVTNMKAMFGCCYYLPTLNVSNFNTTNVTDMEQMFASCWKIPTLDVRNFDTSNVTNMTAMFQDCYAITELDISNFNTSNVTNMNNMFNNCRELALIKIGSGWSIDNVTNQENIFYTGRETEVVTIED